MTTDSLWGADLGAPPNWYWAQERPSFQFQNHFRTSTRREQDRHLSPMAVPGRTFVDATITAEKCSPAISDFYNTIGT